MTLIWTTKDGAETAQANDTTYRVEVLNPPYYRFDHCVGAEAHIAFPGMKRAWRALAVGFYNVTDAKDACESHASHIAKLIEDA
jgi:hypothetical protein